MIQTTYQIVTDNNDDAAIKIVNITDINLPSKTKLIVDIKLCFYSHLIPQIETLLRYPLYTINYQFSLPPVHQISQVIFHNMENKDINIPKKLDIFTIQFPSKYPISLIQTTRQSLAFYRHISTKH